MQTWTAVLTHVALGSVQALVGVPFTNNQIAQTGITVGLQTALLLIQAYVASVNSKTDTKGNIIAK